METVVVVNGAPRSVPAEPDRSLLAVLREELGLTGAKYGCGEGACGSCTVLVDGAAARACVVPLSQVAGRSVRTVEGLADGGELHPVQRAFVEERALQCGYCTPGMVLAAVALLERDPHPDDAAIVRGMDGNICRCSAYLRILRAVRRAASNGLAAGSASEPPASEPSTDDPEPAGSLPRPARAWDRTEIDDRDWFGVLPEGLVAVADGPRGEEWTTSLGGAWVHVGGDGTVTAFTGKVDVGQGNRGSLTQVVAGELGLATDRVRLVMGDTDVCPWDMGTFGSRSTVDAGPILAAAAAGARRALLRLAADRLEVDASDLELTEGRVVVRGTDRSVEVGALVEGRRIVERADGPLDAEDRATPATSLPPFVEDAVAGSRVFASDVSRPGLLQGLILRAPSFGAEPNDLDSRPAEAVPGAVVLREGGMVGVAAPDRATAQRALDAVEARWRTTDQPDEAELESFLRSHPREETGWGGPADERRGDVDRALAEAAITLEATYTAAYIQHVPMEPRAAVAEWEGDRLTVWVGTQRPFGVREHLASELGLDEASIRVLVPATGAAFGGKHGGDVAVEAARLARATGRPVKVRWSRAEEFTWAYCRPAAVIDVRSGLDATGRLVAWDFTNLHAGPNGLASPYAVSDSRERHQPTDGPIPTGAYRGLAATANTFARESHIDELADAAGADPVEFRLRHLEDGRLAEVLRAAVERAGRAGPGERFGVACGVEKGGRVATMAEVEPGDQLRVRRIVTAFDCGAVVDPDNLRNQVEGATIMGLGSALFERIRFAGGRVLNAGLSAYRVPRFSDVPEIEVVLLDRPEEPSAGAGETPIIAVAPAVANAVFASTGRRLRSMPMAG